jgi:hypothetical protein
MKLTSYLHVLPSSSYPVLGLLRPIMDIIKWNPSIASEVFPNFFSLLVNILGPFWNLVRTHPVNIVFSISSVLF